MGYVLEHDHAIYKMHHLTNIWLHFWCYPNIVIVLYYVMYEVLAYVSSLNGKIIVLIHTVDEKNHQK